MAEDPRFANKLKQPKFRRIPKSERKVKIDERFKSMFKDDQFQVKYTVDKRGRPANNTAKENLRRYYELSSNESSQSEQEEEDEPAAIDDTNFAKQDSKISDKIKRRLKNLKVDYARGEGVLLSDSSSDDDEESEEEDEEVAGIDHAWGELDQDAEHTTEITSRLAVCNMNWDRAKAVDLMVLLNCFLPSGGNIESVTIFPSEFGIKRMQEEELKGPIELVDSERKDDEEDGDGSKYHMEKLRQYELNRLKYYYAVVVFDCPKSANKVYEECDGIEYEATSTKFDLRFIPDDVTFDQEPKDVCTNLPDPSEYRPKYFTTCALQQTKVNLTWDETDPNRIEITNRLNSKKEVDYNDVQAYLASTSEEDESESEAEEEEQENLKSLSSINKYKALLLGLENNGESSTKNDGEMEMTWGVDLKEKAEKMVKQKLSEKEKKSPFELFLEKRKEKKKLKREAKRKNEEDDDDDSDDIPSDVDMNDPYFAEEFNKKEFKSKKKNRKEESEEDEDAENQRAELALLLANDDDDGRKHFSLKKIQERENEDKPKKNRRKKKVVKETEKVEDDFKIDVQDERFSALYNNHHFSIDPNDPHYKKTKAIEAIENEKVRRREQKQVVVEKVKVAEPAIQPETQLLIKRMKRKAEAYNSKNKKRKMT